MGAADYDNLSENGVEQSRRLGNAFVERGMTFDAIYVGPKRRHHQTLEHMASAARSHSSNSAAWPDAIETKAMTEVDTTKLGDEAMQRVLHSCPDLAQQLASGTLNDAGREAMRHYVGIFQSLMKRWVRGDFADELPPYEDFSRRVISGVQSIMRAEGRGRRILIVTSGGPVSSIARLALGASAEKAIDLMFAIDNASLTELRYTEDQLSLVRFNDVGYLPLSLVTGI